MRTGSFLFFHLNKGITVSKQKNNGLRNTTLLPRGLLFVENLSWPRLRKEVTYFVLHKKIGAQCMSPFQNVNWCVNSHLFLVLLPEFGSNNVFVGGSKSASGYKSGDPKPLADLDWGRGVQSRCDTGRALLTRQQYPIIGEGGGGMRFWTRMPVWLSQALEDTQVQKLDILPLCAPAGI